MAARPNWWVAYQCAPTVFSRPLSVTWAERHRALVSSGLADASACSAPGRRAAGAQDRKTTPVTAAGIERFCRRPDAPAWLILPLSRGTPAPGVPQHLWRPATPSYGVQATADGFRWHRWDTQAVFPCAGAVPGRAGGD